MASIYSGRGSALGFGEESAPNWGTAVARTNWRPAISSNLLRTIERVPRPNLRTGAAGAMRRGHYTSADNAGGTFSVEATYENVGMLLKHLMGGVGTTGGGPTYTHTYTLGTLPEGLTIENIRGTGTAEVFEGCRINTGTIAVSAGGVMTLDMDVIAETSAARTSAGTPTYGSGDSPILHSHAGQFGFDGQNYDLVDMSITVNNALARRQHLGSAVTKQPLRSDFQSVEMTCQIEVDDLMYAAFLADTQGDATITFTSGSQSCAFTLHNAYLTGASDPVTSAGIISQSLTFVGESDGTDEGLAIAMTNTNSGATDN